MAENFPVQAGAPQSVEVLARQVQQAMARLEDRQAREIAALRSQLAAAEARITDLETP